MNTIHTLFTNGQDVLRIARYVQPTPSVDGHFILARESKGCTVTMQDFLTNWKVFNAHAAFADYLLYTDEVLNDTRSAEVKVTKHMMMWTKGRCLEIGITLATPIKYGDLVEVL
jgi:hypothetical protein